MAEKRTRGAAAVAEPEQAEETATAAESAETTGDAQDAGQDDPGRVSGQQLAKRDGTPGSLVKTPAKFTPVAMILPARLKYEVWEQLGESIIATRESSKWWLGDWVNGGEARYHEKYAQALDNGVYDLGTWKNFAYVAGRFTPERRREELTWSHHQAVAALEPDVADRLLALAVEHVGTSRADLRSWATVAKRDGLDAAIRFARGEEPETGGNGAGASEGAGDDASGRGDAQASSQGMPAGAGTVLDRNGKRVAAPPKYAGGTAADGTEFPGTVDPNPEGKGEWHCPGCDLTFDVAIWHCLEHGTHIEASSEICPPEEGVEPEDPQAAGEYARESARAAGQADLPGTDGDAGQGDVETRTGTVVTPADETDLATALRELVGLGLILRSAYSADAIVEVIAADFPFNTADVIAHLTTIEHVASDLRDQLVSMRGAQGSPVPDPIGADGEELGEPELDETIAAEADDAAADVETATDSEQAAAPRRRQAMTVEQAQAATGVRSVPKPTGGKGKGKRAAEPAAAVAVGDDADDLPI